MQYVRADNSLESGLNSNLTQLSFCHRDMGTGEQRIRILTLRTKGGHHYSYGL